VQLQRLPELEQGLGRITRQLKVYQDIYSYLTQRREETQIARTTEATYTITIIDPPYVKGGMKGSKKLQSLAMGVMLGLAGGVGLALLREKLDLSLKSVQDVEHSLGLPVFGAIPEFKEQSEESTIVDVDPHLILLSQPQASAAEGYRILRTNINFAEPDTRIKTLVVSSALEGEGKSVSVANLAVAISQTGRRTLLIDADLRRPTQHGFFHLEREPGLSDVLAGSIAWQDAVQATTVEGLSVLPCGKLPPNPAELLGSAHMSDLLAAWAQEYEQVLLDSPPLLAVADASLLASKCDRLLLVVRAYQTPREPIERALIALSTVHASVMGVVFNAMDVKRNYRHYYYYDYGYHYNASESDTGHKSRRLFGLLR
jgi:capsular exopolysaccharide synthesis family protein